MTPLTLCNTFIDVRRENWNSSGFPGTFQSSAYYVPENCVKLQKVPFLSNLGSVEATKPHCLLNTLDTLLNPCINNLVVLPHWLPVHSGSQQCENTVDHSSGWKWTSMNTFNACILYHTSSLVWYFFDTVAVGKQVLFKTQNFLVPQQVFTCVINAGVAILERLDSVLLHYKKVLRKYTVLYHCT